MDPGPKGGRKATKLFLNSDWLYVVGMEIRCDSVLLLAIDIEGRVLFSRTVKQQFSAESFSSDILALIKSLKQEETRLNRTLLGIGLGFSGIIDAGKQIIEHSVFWISMHLLISTGKLPHTVTYPSSLKMMQTAGPGEKWSSVENIK